MSTDLHSLTSQALALPAEQRFELAQRLWESVEGALGGDEELFAEIARRDAEMEMRTVKTYSHDEVIRDARKALGE